MADVLTNPPLLDTDIPTADRFITHVTPPRNIVAVTEMLPQTRRYDAAAGRFAALAVVPAGFADQEFRGGIVAVVQAEKANGVPNCHVTFHPSTGHVPKYSTGWTTTATALQPDFWQANAYFVPPVPVILASQRHGGRSYAMLNYQATDSKGNADTGMSLIRIDGVNDINVTDYRVNDYGYVPVFTIGNGDLFVSDDEYPFVWVRETFAGREYVTGFWDKPSAFTSPDDLLGYRRMRESQVSQQGQLGAFRQEVPTTGGLIGSYFVYPWASGDYGPPELWHVVSTDLRTYTVYRSTWMRGVWKMPTHHEFFDGQTIGRRFPLHNRYGYGFDPNPFVPSKKVGAFTLPGTKKPVTAPVLKFFRDPTEPGVMHTVVVANEVGTGGGSTT